MISRNCAENEYNSMDQEEAKFFEELAGVTHRGQHAEESPETREYVDEEVGASGSEEERAALAKAMLTVPMRMKEDRKNDGAPEGQLTIDVYQTPEEIVVESAVAGVKPEDLDISVSNDAVAIRGERHREHRMQDEEYLYQECYWGRFSRSIILPEEVDAERASVDFKNGILVIHLPKMNRQKSKKLRIRTGR